MSQIIHLIDQVDSLVTNGGSATEIKSVLITLRDQCETLEREHAALKELNTSFRKEIAGLEEYHAESNAKLQKLHEEEIARMTADKAEYERGLGDLGQTL